jgi:hypothetical protein
MAYRVRKIPTPRIHEVLLEQLDDGYVLVDCVHDSYIFDNNVELVVDYSLHSLTHVPSSDEVLIIKRGLLDIYGVRS